MQTKNNTSKTKNDKEKEIIYLLNKLIRLAA